MRAGEVEPGGELAHAPESGARGAAGEDRLGPGQLARGVEGVAVVRLHHVVDAGRTPGSR